MKTSSKLVRLMTAAALLINSACTESSGLANVSLRLSNSQVANNNNILSLFFPEAQAAQYGDILFCLERLRFKLPEGVLVEAETPGDDSSETEIEDSIDFELGEVVIDPQGTDLGNIQVPAGTYSRIEFDLDSDCASGKSIQVTNLNGSFSTDEEITIKFDGNFVVTDDTQITLPLAEIVTALDGFNPTSLIQDDIDEELEDLMESLNISVEDDDSLED